MKTLTTILFLAFQASVILAGELELSNTESQIHGPKGKGQLSFQSNKFRFWNSTQSEIHWRIQANKSGSVEILLVQSNNTLETSKLKLSFAGSSVDSKVENTGNWSTFSTVSVGTFNFPKGDHTLKLRAIDKPGVSVMDLQKVIFKGDTEALRQIPFAKTAKTTNSSKSNGFIRKPGRQKKLRGPHPTTSITDLSPPGLNLKVNGLDFLSDGTLVVASWEPSGSVYFIKHYDNPKKRRIHRFAWGLHEPLGLKVINDEIYVVQKQELTKLEDTDGDGVCDFYRNICNTWDVTTNFHEFTFGPYVKDGKFYLALAVAINPGGATTKPQAKDRGCLIEIDPKTKQYSLVAAGLRTPNGIGVTSDGKLLIADNQGDFLPASKVVSIEPGAFYNHRYTPPHPWSHKPVSPPLAWLPQSEIGNSPSDMVEVRSGPYKGDILVGDITNGGLRRLSIETVDGIQQAAVFHFGQGMPGGPNRLIYDPQGNLVVGINGTGGNWGSGRRHGLLKLNWTDKVPFEMKKVNTLSNGVEVTFTKPLQQGFGWDPQFFAASTWTYKPTARYGGPKIDFHHLKIKSATVSSDRTKVFLEIDNIRPGYLVQLLLHDKLLDENGKGLFSSQCWLTVNRVPKDHHGAILSRPNDAVELGRQTKVKEQRHQQIHRTLCISCHTTDGKKLVGPSFKGLFGKRQMVIGKNNEKSEVIIDENYLREAILQPAKVYPEGYQPIMPDLSSSLSKEDIKILIQWIKSQK